MMYPLVTDLATEGIPVVVTCRVLGFSKQAYYKWRANPVSDREWSDAHLINEGSPEVGPATAGVLVGVAGSRSWRTGRG